MNTAVPAKVHIPKVHVKVFLLQLAVIATYLSLGMGMDSLPCFLRQQVIARTKDIGNTLELTHQNFLGDRLQRCNIDASIKATAWRT